MVSILLLCLFFQAQELLTVRVIPNSKLKLALVHVNEIEIQVIELHEVCEHLLYHDHSNWITFYVEELCKVKV